EQRDAGARGLSRDDRQQGDLPRRAARADQGRHPGRAGQALRPQRGGGDQRRRGHRPHRHHRPQRGDGRGGRPLAPDLAGRSPLGRPGVRGRGHHGGPGGVRPVRPQRRDGRQAAHPAARARGRAPEDPRRVRAPGGRAPFRRGAAGGARQAGGSAQPRPRRRRHHPLEGAEPPRALPPGGDDPRRAQEGGRDAQGAAPDPFPRGPALRGGAVQAGSARDPAGDRGDQGLGARGGRAHQGGRVVARREHRPGGRVRGAQGEPCPRSGAGAGGRAHRHRALAPGPGDLRQALAGAGAGGQGAVQLRDAHHDGHRGRGPAFAGHRPQRAERAPRLAAHRLAAGPVRLPRVAGARGGRGALRRRGGRGVREQRLLPARPHGAGAGHPGGAGSGGVQHLLRHHRHGPRRPPADPGHRRRRGGPAGGDHRVDDGRGHGRGGGGGDGRGRRGVDTRRRRREFPGLGL
ncbi:MAG: Transcription termination protein NusA, partial [uncultured Gemmatimonadetes bacterium]